MRTQLIEEVSRRLHRRAAEERAGAPDSGKPIPIESEPAPGAAPAQALPAARPLALVPAACCLCPTADAEPVAIGEDFEYHTSPDAFLVMRCAGCGLLYLDPRPSLAELDTIYPPSYHAFDFSPKRFGLAYHVRCRLESRRLRRLVRQLPPTARILDVGCGDGFHLGLLRPHAKPGWQLEGIDADERAVDAGRRSGLTIHRGRLQDVALPEASYDLVLLIMTIEHLDDPRGVLERIRELLRPGGRLLIVTDNSESPDRALFGRRHWGGYHFPRHWQLFSGKNLASLVQTAGLEVESSDTMMSPVNWVYSVRNLCVDWHASNRVIDRFSLSSPVSLAAFTLFDALLTGVGRGALLRMTARRPT